MSGFEIFGHQAVHFQHSFHGLNERPQVSTFWIAILNLMQRLCNGFQLLVTLDPAPKERFAAVAVNRIPNGLTDQGFNLDSLRIPGCRRIYKRGEPVEFSPGSSLCN